MPILTEGPRSAGKHTVIWEGTDKQGRAWGPAYTFTGFYRLRTADFVRMRKMVRVK